MPDWLKGLLTVVVAIGLAALMFFVLDLAFNKPLDPAVAAVIGAIFGLLYGLEAGILVIYDLNGAGWVQLIIDMTWSLPNTIWGFVIGNLIFIFVGTPSSSASHYQGFISYTPRGGGSFGHSVLQTHGTVNLGGAGQHELVHVMQARIFGPLFLPLYFANYVLNSVVQLLWTGTIGTALWLANVRDTPYFRPPEKSVVGGFFGWIYYYTIFELWGYSS